MSLPTNIAILGAGESGLGAALLGKKLGMGVWVSDGGAISAARKQELIDNQLDFEEGSHSEPSFAKADMVIKSPGIPDAAPIVRALRAAGKPIVSEIEFAFITRPDLRIVAITGSNGKTTTTALTHHLLTTGGIEAALGGNIGKSFARILAENGTDTFVLEVSSFQLDDVKEFRPEIAVLLNITADHLDRYDYRIDRYAAAKFRIAQSQRITDSFVYNMDDPVTVGEMWKYAIQSRKSGFSAHKLPGALAWLEGDDIVLRVGSRYSRKNMKLAGEHNAMNAMAAVLVARRMGVSDDAIQEGLNSFEPIPHRMELIPTRDGKRWINDSKATNVDAVRFALDAMETPTVWIAGGIDKGNDYKVLNVSRVKALVILGPHTEPLVAAYTGVIPEIAQAGSMEEAVDRANSIAQAGDSILLSPACASFDLFKNYEDRGDQFREQVKNKFGTPKPTIS